MRLLINIPKEFEQHFQADRFEDSLHRLSADAHLLAGNYEQETAVMLIKSFKSAVPVPPHGRLGDLDNLRKKFETICDRYDAGIISEGVCMNMMLQEVISAPTIVESEENET